MSELSLSTFASLQSADCAVSVQLGGCSDDTLNPASQVVPKGCPIGTSSSVSTLEGGCPFGTSTSISTLEVGHPIGTLSSISILESGCPLCTSRLTLTLEVGHGHPDDTLKPALRVVPVFLPDFLQKT